MSLDCFTYAFNLGESEHWPTLDKRQAIPENCKSTHNARAGRLGLGFVEALSFLLTDRMAVGRDGEAFSVRYLSNRGGGRERVADARPSDGSAASSGAPPPARMWRGADSMKGPPALCVIEAMLLPPGGGAQSDLLAETRERWPALLEELEVETMAPPPYTKRQLQEAAESELCRRAMMAVCDAIYFALKRFDESGQRDFADDPGTDLPPLERTGYDRLFGRPEPQDPRQALPGGYLARTLEGLIDTGGTALLVGPTGTFKTTTATRAAHEAGAQLQVVKGRPGIEDRDFFGGVVPTPGGPQWVDGPVTESFRKARSEATVLLMDELLRFEPLFLGALVGLLDAASPAALSARSIDPAPGFAAEPHYVAELPTGERVACPTSRLTLVATTNMGTGYVQAGTRLDAALMGRFELVVEVEAPDPGVKRHLYEQAAGAKGADLLEAVEDAVAEGHIDRGGLYVRKAHPRLMLNMARQMDRILASEHQTDDPLVAAQEAAGLTVVPNCTQRQATGLLDPSGRDSLLGEVADCAEAIL